MLLLWSGGCDSTALVCDYYSKNPIWFEEGFLKTGKPLRTLAITHPQVGAGEENRRARKEVMRRLAKRGFSLSHTEINLDSKGPATLVAAGLPQPYMWITLATAYLEEGESIITGWVRGDDVWHSKHDIECMFGWAKTILGKTGYLEYPLEYVTKPEVITYLKKHGMYSATWYCETPKSGKRCGNCTPCTTHATALWQIARSKAKKNKRKVKV